VFRELPVSGRRSDPDAFGVVGDLVRVKREHRQPLLLPAGAEPPVRLHRIALGKREKREIPHRMMPDARCPGLQHGLRDLGNLKRAGRVRGMDLEYAERHDRGRVECPGNEMGVPAAEPAVKRDRRLGEVPHLQHLPAPCRLEDAQRPILPVTLGGDHPGVDGLKRFVVLVGCREDPRSEQVRETGSRVVPAVELTAFCGQQDLPRAPEVE
jgi:hypothetical protein